MAHNRNVFTFARSKFSLISCGRQVVVTHFKHIQGVWHKASKRSSSIHFQMLIITAFQRCPALTFDFNSSVKKISRTVASIKPCIRVYDNISCKSAATNSQPATWGRNCRIFKSTTIHSHLAAHDQQISKIRIFAGINSSNAGSVICAIASMHHNAWGSV